MSDESEAWGVVIMGGLAGPLVIGETLIRADEKVPLGEYVWDQDPERPMMRLNIHPRTYEYLGRRYWGLRDNKERFEYWDKMPTHRFYYQMMALQNAVREHFYEEEALRHILNRLKSNLERYKYQKLDDQTLSSIHRMVCDINAEIAHVMMPCVMRAPIKLRVIQQGSDTLLVDRVPEDSLPHQEFLKEFEDVLLEFSQAIRG